MSHLLKAVRPVWCQGAESEETTGPASLNWTRGLLISEPLRMTERDQNKNSLVGDGKTQAISVLSPVVVDP